MEQHTDTNTLCYLFFLGNTFDYKHSICHSFLYEGETSLNFRVLRVFLLFTTFNYSPLNLFPVGTLHRLLLVSVADHTLEGAVSSP